MLLANIWLNDNIKESDDTLSITSSTSTIRDLFELPSDIDISAFHKSVAQANYYSADFVSPVSSDDDIESSTSFYKVPIRRSSKVENILTKTLCMIILDNCIDQYTVMTNGYKSIAGEVEHRDIMYRTLEERYHFNQPANYEDHVINSNYTNFHKMLKDVSTLIVVLKGAHDELNIFSYFTFLDNYVESERKMQQDEELFLEVVKRKQEFFNELNRSYTNYRIESAKKFQETKTKTCGLFTKINEEMDYTHTKLSFVKNWEAARREQNTMILQSRERHYKNKIEDMEKAKTLDTNVHQDIAKFLAEVEEDSHQEIERWMYIYDREFEERDMDIYRIKNRTEALIERKESLSREYERRAREIEEWLVYKREKKEAEERIALENWAVVRIQAWWRGVMVRKKLGPYRKKKKKGKGAKGKEKMKVKKAKRSK